MQDAESDDRTTAETIRKVLARLNEELDLAARAGLFVDIQPVRGYEIGLGDCLILQLVKLERRSPL